MKKILPLVFAAACVLLVTGCESTKVAFDPYENSPVAVVSILANNKIEWANEQSSSGGALSLGLDLLASKKGDEETQVMLGYTKPLMPAAEAAVTEGLQEAGFTLVAKEDVINTDAYMSAKNNKLFVANLNEPAEGYKLLSVNDKYSPSLIEATGASCVAYVTFDFSKRMVKGIAKTGTMTGDVNVIINLVDSNNKSIKYLRGYASGTKNIKVAAGVYDPEELSSLYAETAKAAVANAMLKL